MEVKISDLEIQQHVIDELKWEPILRENQIGVNVRDGIVRLFGFVESQTKKYAAEQAVKRVKGVRAVVEELEVIIPKNAKRKDEEIAKAAIEVLKWHSEIPDEAVQVFVENGKVILEGVVEWQFQRKAAEESLAKLEGVNSVVNKIVLNPPLHVSEVKSEIEYALNRSSIIDPAKIIVEVVGSKVILSGTVISWVERTIADEAAWAAPGISKVDNRIKVRPEDYNV